MTLRKLEAEDLYQLQLISDYDIAPDGKRAILAIQEIDPENEKKFTNLWTLNLENKELQPFTTGKFSNSTPVWSPDGNSIVFLSNREDEKQGQLYIISTLGGEARKLTNFEGEFSNFLWGPNSKNIYTCYRKKDQETIENNKDEKKQKLGTVYREIDKTFYRLDGFGWYPKDDWHLWKIDIHTGEGKQICDLTIEDGSAPFISCDEQWLGFFSNQAEDPHLDPDAIDLYLLNLNSGLTRKIETPAGSKDFGVFSPTGDFIAYVGKREKWADWQNNHLWVVASNGETAATDLTAAYDLHVASATLNDNGPAPFSPPIWSLNEEWIYFQTSRHGNTILQKINRETKQLTDVIAETGVVGKPKFNRNQNRLLFILGSMDALPQIFISQKENGFSTNEKLTHLNEKWFNQIQLGKTQEYWFTGVDGNDLQGWIIQPPDFNPAQKYPSILEIHGGPLLQYGNFWMHEFHYLAAQGYVVYFCNPRGGQGYGEGHSVSIHNGKWGTKDYQDIMSWTDYVEKLPYFDSDRMGVTGGSYGGYMTVWIIGHTDRFQAAVSQRCVSNLLSMWGSSDFNWSFQKTFGDKAPYEDIETLWECSPMKHIGSAHTPTLIIHSEQDLRCPLEQSQQVYTALRTLKVPTKMIIFPDEPHGLSRMGRTDRRIIRLKQIASWFNQYLK